MKIEDYGFVKHCADSLEEILLRNKDNPESMYTSALNIIEGFKTAYHSEAFDKAEKQMDLIRQELEQNHDKAAEILYRLLKSMRIAQLNTIYKEVVEPSIIKTKEDMS